MLPIVIVNETTPKDGSHSLDFRFRLLPVFLVVIPKISKLFCWSIPEKTPAVISENQQMYHTTTLSGCIFNSPARFLSAGVPANNNCWRTSAPTLRNPASQINNKSAYSSIQSFNTISADTLAEAKPSIAMKKFQRRFVTTSSGPHLIASGWVALSKIGTV